MPNCKYCGTPAGFFHWQHAECGREHEEGKEELAKVVTGAASDSSPLDSLLERVNRVAEKSYISSDEARSLTIRAWNAAVDHSLERGVLELGQEQRLIAIKNHLSLTQFEADSSGAFSKVVKAGVIREVMSGVVPHRMTVTELPVNLQKGEQVVWVFLHCDYLEDKTHRQYVGGSRGVSIRVMKGVYYHVGDFRGHTIERTDREHVDTGTVVITDRNVYFAGPAKSLRIPYSKIVSFQPFSDGIGLTRDAAGAKPQILVTHDGWFTYNLVTNLAKL